MSSPVAVRGGATDRALIVEDDPDVAQLLSRRLTRLGMRVCSVGSAEEAMTALAGAEVRITFVDVNLPGVDGWTFIRSLRSRPRTREMVIVIVTVEDETPEHRTLVDGWLPKPFDQRAVEAIVGRLVGPDDGVDDAGGG